MDIVCNYDVGEACPDPCDGQWLSCAKEVLALTQIKVSEFACEVRTLLEMVRGKHSNTLIVGPTNLAKTFMLKPLQSIFKRNLLENPANNTFAWVGAQKATCMLLNDFPWSNKLIIWKNLLLLLEVKPVKLSAPKISLAKIHT